MALRGGEEVSQALSREHAKQGWWWPGATLAFDTVVGCHWLAFLRDLHSSPAGMAAIFCRNDSAAPG
jgi:hypothetical protein